LPRPKKQLSTDWGWIAAKPSFLLWTNPSRLFWAFDGQRHVFALECGPCCRERSETGIAVTPIPEIGVGNPDRIKVV